MTIIVPLDGSRLGEGILPHVEAMAKSRGTGIVDVVCEAPAISSDYPDDMSVSWEENVEQEVTKLSGG